MYTDDMSLRLKILFTCALIVVSIMVFASISRIIGENTPSMRNEGYKIFENSSAGQEFDSADKAYKFISGKENVNIENLTIQSLSFNENCGGYEYEIYVNSKNIKYDICQNGQYTISNPVPMGIDKMIESLLNVKIGSQ